jgi:hypothetical protein
LINTKNLPVIGFSIECHRDLLFVDAHPKKTAQLYLRATSDDKNDKKEAQYDGCPR